jgi:hypothetical protein
MAISVEELVTRFTAEAVRRGVTPEHLLDELATDNPRPRRKLGFVSLGASSSGLDSDDIDTMLADGFGHH